jgi:hypothetical protein
LGLDPYKAFAVSVPLYDTEVPLFFAPAPRRLNWRNAITNGRAGVRHLDLVALQSDASQREMPLEIDLLQQVS